MKKTFFKLILILNIFGFITLFGALSLQARYTGSRGIYPTNAEFSTAKEIKRTIGSNVYGSTSSGSYKLFYYRTSEAGAYNIYTSKTTNSIDTVGALFRDDSFLFIKNYKHIAEDDDSGLLNNFRIEVDLQSSKDYYVGVRGYGTTSGSYYVKMEKNLDEQYSNIGGYWVQDTAYMGLNHVGDTQESQVERMYFTKDQTAVYYRMLEDNIHSEIISMLYSADSIEDIYTYILFSMDIVVTLTAPALVSLVYTAFRTFAFNMNPTSSDRIANLSTIKYYVSLYGNAVNTDIPGSVSVTFQNGIYIQSYFYSEIPWWSWTLSTIGIFLGVTSAPMTVSNNNTTYGSNHYDVIQGRILERGTIYTDFQ